MSEGAEIADIDLEEADDLPPHRAAIPVAPGVLGLEQHVRRRNLVRIAVVFSLALHVGFFLAALMWGQGRPFPEADGKLGVVRVHLAQSGYGETVIEKAPASEAQAADPAGDDANAPPAGQTPPAPPASIEAQQPGPVALTVHVEPRPAASAVQERNPNPPDTAAPHGDNRATADAQANAVKMAALADEDEDATSRFAAPLAEQPSEGKKPPVSGYKPAIPRRKGGENATTASPGDEGARSAANAAAATRGAVFSYKRRVRTLVMRNLPEGRWGPGRVVVGFRVSRSGELLGSSIARSSGNTAIDRAALACVRSAGPFPAPPRGAMPAELALSMDFRFQ
jgi:periplasmic protein TonB